MGIVFTRVSLIRPVTGSGLVAVLVLTSFCFACRGWSDDARTIQNVERAYQGPSLETTRLQREVQRLADEVERLRKIIESRPLSEPPTPLPEPTRVTAPSKDTITIRPTQRFDGHQDLVSSVAVAPSGAWGASASHDGTVRVWDLIHYSQNTVLETPGKQLYSVAWSPDGKLIAAGGMSGLYLLRAETGELVRSFPGVKGWVRSLQFSRDGQKLLSGGGNVIQIWDLTTGAELNSHTVQVEVTNVSRWTRDERQLFCIGGYLNNSATTMTYFARLWNPESGQESFRLGYPVRTVFRDARLLADDTRVLTVGPSGHLQEWDIATGQEHRMWLKNGGVKCLDVSDDGRFVVTASTQKLVQLWDTESARVIDTYTLDDSAAVECVALSADARRAIVGGRDHAVRSFHFHNLEAPTAGQHVSSLPVVRRLQGHTKFVYAVAVSPDGKRAASGGFDLTLRQWDLETATEISRYDGSKAYDIVNDIAYTPDGRQLLLACGQYRGTQRVKVWDVEQWREARELTGHDHVVTAVAVSPDGKLVATGSVDATARLWDLADGRLLHTFASHTNSVRDVAFSPDGRLLASASVGRTVRLWDVDTGREVRQFKGHRGEVHAVAFSPTKPWLLSAGGNQGDSAIRVWDFNTGDELRRLSGHSGLVRQLRISPDGRLVLSTASDGIRLWSVDSGAVVIQSASQELLHLPGAYAPDGQRIITGAPDHALEVWSVPADLP